uniref:6-cysteine protein n=1 Tax=Parastrongyloides trichosuri TaxID=131310 RepID=A0A0N4ZPS6_PARTI
MKVLFPLIILQIFTIEIKTTCLDHSTYQLKGKTFFETEAQKGCSSSNEKCIYVSANDPDNFRGTISGCMNEILSVLSNISFHSVYDDGEFIDDSRMLTKYIQLCYENGTVDKEFTSTTGKLSLYFSCFEQNTKLDNPNKKEFIPIVRDLSPVTCTYPWSDEETIDNFGFLHDTAMLKDNKENNTNTCTEGYCSIFKMRIYSFTTKQYYDYAKFGCLNDLYYYLDEFVIHGTSIGKDPLKEARFYELKEIEGNKSSVSPSKELHLDDNNEKEIDEVNIKDEINIIKTNNLTTVHCSTHTNIDKREHLKQSTLLNYFKTQRLSKVMIIGSKKIESSNIYLEPNENKNNDDNFSTTCVQGTKRDMKSSSSIFNIPNEEPPLKRTFLDVVVTEKEKKSLKESRYDAKIEVYRKFELLPLPEVYIQEKEKITLDKYLKSQLTNILSNKNFEPLQDLAINSDFLLEDENDETFTDLYVPFEEAFPETPFANSLHILESIKEKYIKDKQ